MDDIFEMKENPWQHPQTSKEPTPQQNPATNKKPAPQQKSQFSKDLSLVFSSFSIFVGVVLLAAEVSVIGTVVISDPSDLRLPMEMALSKVQRIVLGLATVVMLTEAVVFGTIDIGMLTW